MKNIFAILLLIIALTVLSMAQTIETTKNRNGKIEQELLLANKEYDLALVKGDAVSLDRIYSDEFVYTTPEGEVRDKTQQLSFTRSGELKLEFGQSDDVKFRIYKDTAVMTGRFTGKGTFKERTLIFRSAILPSGLKRKESGGSSLNRAILSSSSEVFCYFT